MALVARGVASSAAKTDNPRLIDQHMATLLSFGDVYNRGAHWPSRSAATDELMRKVLAKIPREIFDQIAERPDRLTRRIIEVERRLNILERWRLEMTATSMDSEE